MGMREGGGLAGVEPAGPSARGLAPRRWTDETMVMRAVVFWCLSAVLAVLSCGPHGGDPKVGPGPTRIDPPARGPGETCTPAGAIVDERFNAVDMKSEASVRASAGHPIFICAPIRRAMSGRVVDATTRSPVAGATLTVESWHARPPIGGISLNRQLLKMIEVWSDAQGRWKVLEESIWMPGILAADGLPFVLSSYCVRANGYSTFVVDPWKQDTHRSEDSLAEVGLHAVAGAVEKPDSSLSNCGLPLGPPL